MFPYAEMLHIELTPPVTEKNFVEQLGKYIDYDDLLHLGNSVMIQVAAPIENSEYSLSGEAYFVRPFLPNPTAISSFLHVQNVGLIFADNNYFTRRGGTDSYMLLYTLSGEGYLEYEGKSHYLRSGDGFLIDCNQPHFYKTVKKEWNHCVVHFHGTGAKTLYQTYKESHPVLFHQPLNGTFQNLLEEQFQYQTTLVPYRDAQITGNLYRLLLFLLTETSAAEDNTAKTVQSVIRYMEEHLSDPLNLDVLEQEFHISKFHLSREFRKLTGYPPIEYLIRMRLEQAQFLLSYTDLPVYRIAEAVGVPNEQYFGKLFKSRFGETPGRFRKKA